MKTEKLLNFNGKQLLSIFFIAIFSCLLNFYVGSRGVFPVDTFIHFDQGFRILNGEHPVKDYWIVHGFLIDYIQAAFFWTFGLNWSSYLLHSSLFNSIISVSFFILLTKYLELKLFEAICFSILLACLSYPVSGTPFLDLHSSFFSMLGIFSIVIGILKNKNFYWLLSSVLFSAAFFSKQVPAFYIILTSSIFCIYYSIINNNIKIFYNYLFGGVISIFSILLILFINEIRLSDFIFQLFIFPKSIGDSRYENYIIDLKNIFFDFKFIYLFLSLYFIFHFLKKKKQKKYLLLKKTGILFIIILFTFSSIFHQIFTKNQIYIFFLIPLLGAFCLYSLNDYKNKNVKKIRLFLTIVCILLSFKYFVRFDVERKFHELNNTKIENSIDFISFDEKFKNLKWISPHYRNPAEEIIILNKMKKLLKRSNIMLISEYNFFSFTMNKSFYSPSRTYDEISYPNINSEYYSKYKSFLINKIKKNKIDKIYILKNKKINEKKLNHLIFNYIPSNCFNFSYIDLNIIELKIKNCKDLDEIK